uniref:dimethyl sulfoxide reductase anchor subunit family protein n=1 Tax=Marinobacterium profundum TaxID=1714300 RepID=UPI000835D74B|nr:DmsC/YnfH family molybdoenzyme membrane anchor subunit [Marinobacterium profundum]
MHPAFSVLIFTVTSGAGYGLFALMVLAQLAGLNALQDSTLLLSGGVLALLMITIGLLSSTLHLANPKNAWRSFARFRTSWLSREAVFAVLFYPVALLYLFGIYVQGSELSALYSACGVVAAMLAMVTLFCTSMIYASLKTIRQWCTALTPLNYLSMGLMSGALCLATLQALLQDGLSPALRSAGLGLIALGAVAKLIYLFWIGKPAGATIKTATGFTQASVRLLDAGHSAGTFLTNEFGYTVAANKLLRLRFAMVALAFVVPFLLLLQGHAVATLLAALLALAGLLVERWLFFAEARHVVRLYHGDQRT